MIRMALLSLALAAAAALSQEVIDISVRGISDQTKDGAQKDRMEAVLDAKRQACEKAGLTISAKTTVENFKTVFDYVESQAEGVLLPGFQVIDVGYMEDGTYAVVIVGKVQKTGGAPSGTADFTIIVWLRDKGQNITEKGDLVDKLYEWLSTAHGVFTINGTTFDKLEDNLVSVARRDTAYYGGRRFYAFTYRIPAGDLNYAQRTPTTSGDVSEHNYNLKLRKDQKYAIQVAHLDAVYFQKPERFEKSVKHPQENFLFPDNFRAVYSSK